MFACWHWRADNEEVHGSQPVWGGEADEDGGADDAEGG